MIIMILMFSSLIFAQTDEDYNLPHLPPRPGDALISFTKIYYIGFAFQAIGVGIIVYGQLASEEDIQMKTLTYVGSGLALGGSIVQVVSFSLIAKAGKLNNPEQTLPLLRSKVGQFAGIISIRKSIL